MSCDKSWNWHSQSACGSFFITVVLLVDGDHEALKVDLTLQKSVTGKFVILHKATKNDRSSSQTMSVFSFT